MRVTIPYTYEAEARNSAGVWRTNAIDASLTAEVREFDPRDAPVVLRHAGFYNQHPRFQGHAARPLANALADVRSVSGKLYEQVVWADRDGRALATADDLSSPAWLFCDVPYVAKRANAPDDRYWSESGKTVYEKTKREEAADAVRSAADLACIGGMLYRASPEPVFVFDEDDDRHRPRDRRVPRIGRALRYMHTPTFRLDDADLVAEMVLARGGTAAQAVAVAGMAEVLDPSALTQGTRDDAIRSAGRRLTDRASRDLHLRRLGTMLAFADLKDVGGYNREDRDPAVVADRMSAYCDAADEEPRPVERRHSDPRQPVVEARVEMAAYARHAPPRVADLREAAMESFTPGP